MQEIHPFSVLKREEREGDRMYLHEYNFQETECRAPVHLFSCVPVSLASCVD